MLRLNLLVWFQLDFTHLAFFHCVLNFEVFGKHGKNTTCHVSVIASIMALFCCFVGLESATFCRVELELYLIAEFLIVHALLEQLT